MNFLSGIWGDQCIIFRDQGSTDPGGLPDLRRRFIFTFEWHSVFFLWFRKVIKNNIVPSADIQEVWMGGLVFTFH